MMATNFKLVIKNCLNEEMFTLFPFLCIFFAKKTL